MNTILQKTQLLLLAGLMFLSASAFTQLRCYTLQAPEKIIPQMKKLAIIDFSDRNNARYSYWNRDAANDYGSILADAMLSDLMEEYRGVYNTAYNNYLGVKTNVYTVVERSQLDAIMKEQHLGASGAVSEGDAAQAGKLLGLDVILTGKFSTNSEIKTSSKKNYKTVDGVKKYTHTDYYKWRETKAESKMKIISVTTGQVLALIEKDYKRKSKTASSRSGYPSNSAVESEYDGKTGAMEGIARLLTGSFTPRYVAQNFNFDKPKNKEYKQQGKDAKKAIKDGDVKTVYHLLKGVMAEDDSDEAIVHDLAIVYEAVGDYDNAIKYHNYADQLSGKKKYERSLARSKSGKAAIDALKALGVTITPYDFGADNTNVAETKLSKLRVRVISMFMLILTKDLKLLKKLKVVKNTLLLREEADGLKSKYLV
jgi:curli biogenesis system outer membrane secretion channel CsgG